MTWEETSGQPQVERRRHPRVTLDWPVTIALSDGTHEARLRDVSRAGVCFFLDRRIPEMTILRMQLDLPPGLGSGAPVVEDGPLLRIEGGGVVVRCQALSPHVDHYEVAVFLNDIDDDNRDRLEEFLVAREG